MLVYLSEDYHNSLYLKGQNFSHDCSLFFLLFGSLTKIFPFLSTPANTIKCPCYIGLTGDDSMNPKEMAKFSEKSGYYTENGTSCFPDNELQNHKFLHFFLVNQLIPADKYFYLMLVLYFAESASEMIL